MLWLRKRKYLTITLSELLRLCTAVDEGLAVNWQSIRIVKVESWSRDGKSSCLLVAVPQLQSCIAPDNLWHVPMRCSSLTLTSDSKCSPVKNLDNSVLIVLFIRDKCNQIMSCVASRHISLSKSIRMNVEHLITVKLMAIVLIPLAQCIVCTVR